MVPKEFILHLNCFSDHDTIGRFVSDRLTQRHQEALSQLFSSGHIKLDDELIYADITQISKGQKVEVYFSDHFEEKVNTQWRLLWENDELLAVYKPHLLPVSRTTRNLYNTLISLVRRESPYATAHLLHRLDTETAGIVVLAKNSEADKKWKQQLDQLITQKIYHACVSGVPDWDEMEWECELSEKIGSPIRSQVYVVDPESPELYPKPKLSKTVFRVLKREEGKSLVECQLFTGRKHQIRVHLSYLGYPIIGDKVYAFSGHYYLKRISDGLNATDISILGGEHHQLIAKQVVLNLNGDNIYLSV